MATPKDNGVPLKGKKASCELCGEDKCKCAKDIRVYFCPECQSTEVRYSFGLGNLFGVIPKMKCLKCGYSATTFPILVTNKKNLAKATKKLKKKNAAKKKKAAKKSKKKIVGRKK